MSSKSIQSMTGDRGGFHETIVNVRKEVAFINSKRKVQKSVFPVINIRNRR